MRFRILGPVDVVDDGTLLPLGAHKPRALLAALILARGEVVSVDRLVDALWGESPPSSATKSVHVYVSNLRKVVGDRLETRGKGYRLRIEPGDLDAMVFEEKLREGGERLRAGEAEAAAAVLSAALGLWRGPPLADLAYEPFAQSEIARLDELRVTALEERVDADLLLSRHGALVGELEGLVRDHPLRERLHGQLMLALYGAGRQADALAAYQRARDTLVGELGVEPGPELRDIHAAVLRQDPELTTSGRVSARVRARRRGGVLVAAGGALIVAAAAVAGALALGGEADELVPARPLAGPLCSPLQQGADGAPDVLVIADQDLSGTVRSIGNQVSASVEFMLRRRGFRAGRYAVGYQACDGVEREGTLDACTHNAQRYARNRAIVGVIGPTFSACAVRQIPVVNRAPGGPLAMISPSNTQVGLTRRGSGTQPREPDVYYPSGVRNYVRLMPADDLQGAAHAVLADRRGIRRVFVVELDGGAAVADAFVAAGDKLGLRLVGRGLASDRPTFDRTLRAARGARPDAVLIAGGFASGGDIVAEEMRAALGPDVHLLGPDGFSVPELRDYARVAEGMIVSVPGVPPAALRGDARRLVEDLEDELGRPPDQYAVHAAQAAELLLDAIGRSDGTRRSVTRELLSSRVQGGILGDFAVTETGDTTATQVAMYRVSRGRLRLVEVLRPPVNLLTGGYR